MLGLICVGVGVVWAFLGVATPEEEAD